MGYLNPDIKRIDGKHQKIVVTIENIHTNIMLLLWEDLVISWSKKRKHFTPKKL